MHLLFEKSYPKYLVEALDLVHQLDDDKAFIISLYDKSVDDSQLKQPVVFLFDYCRKGLDVRTEMYYESGFRVFALKIKREGKLNFFDLSLTVLSLWPKMIELVRKKNAPFVYTYKYGGRKLSQAKA